MRVFQTQAVVGANHMLQIQVPGDVPPGQIEVIIVLDRQPSPQQSWSAGGRRAAAEAGFGALPHIGSVDEFLQERREDEERRERALGR